MRVFLVFAAVVLLALFLLPGCGGGSKLLLLPNKPYGLCFGAYVDGTSPDLRAVPDAVQVTRLLEALRPYTDSIYVYSCSPLKNSTESTASIAHKLGFYVAAGCWLSKDKVANEREISYILSEIAKGNVDLAVVGSEVLLRQDLTSAEMIDYIRRVKAARVPVSYADSFHEIIIHPEIVAELDKVMVNIYPFWAESNITTAFDDFLGFYTEVRETYPGKEVIIAETGWPSAGNTIGQAVPSKENALAYLQKILDWSNSNSIKCYYFEAYDEPYKVAKEGLLGAHWGLWSKDAVLKAGVLEIFKNEPNVSDPSLPIISIADSSFPEGDNSYTISISAKLSKQSTKVLTVKYATVDGSALAGKDYQAKTGTITFPAGTTTAAVSLAILGNLLREADKNFTIKLTAPQNGVVIQQNATITLQNDDAELALTILQCPKIGEYSDLRGRCTGLIPADYRIAVYIKVGAGWWTKPSFASPSTSINADGSWVCDITTGGIDQTASDVAVFLIRATTIPPTANGGGLPAVDAVKTVLIDRTLL